jgi:hypothetical protein
MECSLFRGARVLGVSATHNPPRRFFMAPIPLPAPTDNLKAEVIPDVRGPGIVIASPEPGPLGTCVLWSSDTRLDQIQQARQFEEVCYLLANFGIKVEESEEVAEWDAAYQADLMRELAQIPVPADLKMPPRPKCCGG